jgi:ribosomal protein L14E/L6E/L27E
VDAVVGRIVRSAAGRDKGKFMVITALPEKDFCLIADGKERKLEKPKKKRLKHLKFTNTVIKTDNLTDKALRAVIREYREGGR